MFNEPQIDSPPPEAGKTPESKPAQQLSFPLVFRLHAYHLAEALKLKEVAKLFDLKPLQLNPTKLVYELGTDSYCLLYNFGSVVFFNVAEEVQQTTLNRLKEAVQGDAAPVTSDEFLFEVERRAKNTVTFDKVMVDKRSREKIEIIALVLAQSTALEYFEYKVEDILNRIETVRGKKIEQFIGMVMATKQKLIATLSLLEKPEETWENKILDDLHREATLMFELKDRFRALDYKLKMIQENLELLASLSMNRQMLILEAAIVALFVIDIFLIGYEIFLK